ncbi:hypothetical protein ABTY00_06135 [Streptomyces microflavus]|uniref:hypothetical protein n=1 Tax=Streptomyces microflavus TaxID=1919 RepID=UPI003321A58E
MTVSVLRSSQAASVHEPLHGTDADRYATVLEDLAANGLPPVQECTPWEELREAPPERIAGTPYTGRAWIAATRA